MNINIFGLGTVGSGVYELINKKKFTFSKNNKYNLLLKNNYKDYFLLFKKNSLFIETIGGINLSIEILLNSLKKKNNFITANKDLISKYIFFISFLFKKNNKKFFFEASVCGVMPIINIMKNFYFLEKNYYLFGIINGTCNFILSKINKLEFKKLIKISIKKGFSEKNYKNDIFGFDNIYKISIIVSYIKKIFFSSLIITLESMFGINNFLRKFSYSKKYISFFFLVKNYFFFYTSLFITKNIFLKNTKKTNNLIFLNGKNSKKNFFCSLGAGKTETAYSVLTNYYQLFCKKKFLNSKCINIMKLINKNYFCFNYIIKIKFNYNIFYFLFLLKIFFIKYFNLKIIIIKTKKIFFKKLLFFLYFLKKNKFLCYKFL